MKKYKHSILSWFIVIVIFVFLFKLLFQNIKNLQQYSFNINVYFFFFAFLVMCLGLLFEPLIWISLFYALGEKISYQVINEIASLARMGTFIPGRVWAVGGAVYLLHQEGIAKEKGVIVPFLLVFLGMLVGGVLGLKVIITELGENRLKILGVIILLFLLFNPYSLNKTFTLLFWLVKKKKINFSMSFIHYLKVLFFLSLYWGIQGIGGYFVLRAIYPLSFTISNFFTILGAHSISWIIAFLTFLTPAGLGVKEGIFTYILSKHLPFSVSLIFSILLRLFGVSAFTVFFLIFGRKRLKKINLPPKLEH